MSVTCIFFLYEFITAYKILPVLVCFRHRTTTSISVLQHWYHRRFIATGLAFSIHLYDRPAFSSPAFSVVPIHLLCAEQNLPQVLRHRLNTYGRPRAFAIAGPAAWNSLPDPVRNSNSTKAAFGRQIKHFCTLGTSARSALGASTGDALYKSILFDFSLACISAFREY